MQICEFWEQLSVIVCFEDQCSLMICCGQFVELWEQFWFVVWIGLGVVVYFCICLCSSV